MTVDCARPAGLVLQSTQTIGRNVLRPLLQVVLVLMDSLATAVNVLNALLLVVPVPDRQQTTALFALPGLTSLMVTASQPTVTVSVKGRTGWLEIEIRTLATVRLSGVVSLFFC